MKNFFAFVLFVACVPATHGQIVNSFNNSGNTYGGYGYTAPRYYTPQTYYTTPVYRPVLVQSAPTYIVQPRVDIHVTHVHTHTTPGYLPDYVPPTTHTSSGGVRLTHTFFIRSWDGDGFTDTDGAKWIRVSGTPSSVRPLSIPGCRYQVGNDIYFDDGALLTTYRRQ